MGSQCCKGQHPESAILDDLYVKRYGQPRPQIEHVVVLMLENRTFDNILGSFMDKRMQSGEVKPSHWDVDAQAGKGLYDYTNIARQEEHLHGTTFPVWSATNDIMSDAALAVPVNHPVERFTLLNKCVYQTDNPTPDDKPSLGGFAQQFYDKEVAEQKPITTDFKTARSPAMHVFTPEQAGVFTELAEQFALSDTYFSSAPCQTWPNRFFAVAGQCYGYVNNGVDRTNEYESDIIDSKAAKIEMGMRLRQFDAETVFNRLLDNGVEWACYSGGTPLCLLNRQLQNKEMLKRFYLQTQFASHVESGQLPPFTWIEPMYHGAPPFTVPANDMHPPRSILYAQNLVANIYNTLRSNEQVWRKTLFLVTCDEGVGVFDHVPPPEAPDPDAGCDHVFYGQKRPSQEKEFAQNPFTRYGTRVPCVVASPFVEQGGVLRPPPDSKYPFDHTSIIRTVFDLFVGADCYLTNRDKLAPSLLPSLRTTPREDLGPSDIKLKRALPPWDENKERQAFEEGSSDGCHSVPGLYREASKSDAPEELKVLMECIKQVSIEGKPSHVKAKVSS